MNRSIPNDIFAELSPDRRERVQALFAALEADRAEAIDPPEGLALAGLARTAEFAVAEGWFTPPGTFVEPRSTAEPRRPELRNWAFTGRMGQAAVLAAMVLIAVGLGLHLIQHLRREAATVMCQNHLRGLHAALCDYSERHDGRFPKAGTIRVPSAGDFLAELSRSGVGVPDESRWCPSLGKLDPDPVGYSYALGFRDGGELNGLWRPTTASDATPILADLPATETRPAPHRGWNVLTVGGSVRATTVSTIGIEGDDIFLNAAGERRAGLHRGDNVLGSPYDRP